MIWNVFQVNCSFGSITVLSWIFSSISIAKWKWNNKTNSISISNAYKHHLNIEGIGFNVLMPYNLHEKPHFASHQTFNVLLRIHFQHHCFIFSAIVAIACKVYLSCIYLLESLCEFIGFIEYIWLKLSGRGQKVLLLNHSGKWCKYHEITTTLTLTMYRYIRTTESGKQIHLFHFRIGPLCPLKLVYI